MIITRITAEQEQWAKTYAGRTMGVPEIKAYNRRNGTVYEGIDQLLAAEPGEDVFKFHREAWVLEQAERS